MAVAPTAANRTLADSKPADPNMSRQMTAG